MQAALKSVIEKDKLMSDTWKSITETDIYKRWKSNEKNSAQS